MKRTNEIIDVLMCPKTGNKLRFDNIASVMAVEDSLIRYPVIDGIVDFCHETGDTVSKSYDGFASYYDFCMKPSNKFIKLFNRLIWGSGYDIDYTEMALSYLPSRFNGILLDVPVGTGVFTESLYARYPGATIIGVDYSMGMLQVARKRFEKRGLNNVYLVRADVSNLPLAGGSVDIMLSMAGLHAFPDKQTAVAEMRRVLRPDGSLVASCYIKGDSRRTDCFVKHFGVRKGFFSPPFFTMDDISSHLNGFTIKRQEHIKSGIYFHAVKEC